MQWFAQAPANIALIKYMGKKDKETNLPANPSLSYTLDDLLTSVNLESHPGKHDYWEPLTNPGADPFVLSSEGQTRFLHHLQRIKTHLNYSGSFTVQSSNNFPMSSGLASSASSFAALTKCAITAICEMQKRPLPDLETMANLSRLGSGSSCRSFFSPWALWEETEVKSISLPYKKLHHEVIIISHQEKAVSSSEAHLRIKSSEFYPERVQRAEDNLQKLLQAFDQEDWKKAYKICWREFQDMHQLFSTCDKPFTYMTENTHQALNILQNLWDKHEDGPLITMDAGPNIHLLYRPDQKDMAAHFKQDYLINNYDFL